MVQGFQAALTCVKACFVIALAPLCNHRNLQIPGLVQKVRVIALDLHGTINAESNAPQGVQAHNLQMLL